MTTAASKMKNKDDRVFLRMKREMAKEGYALNIGHMYVLLSADITVTILIVGSKKGKFLLVLYIQREKLLPSPLLVLVTMGNVIYYISPLWSIEYYYKRRIDTLELML
jgi:hypothetical protein